MHNLAVLYAHGAGGRPDQAAAAEWFRKAAMHGVIDSQFNLAVLYERGAGVEQNAAEAYKWYALAARQGDAGAARKRDEIARQFDAHSLAAMNMAIEAFITQSQPEDSTSVKTPPGGWDKLPPSRAEAETGSAIRQRHRITRYRQGARALIARTAEQRPTRHSRGSSRRLCARNQTTAQTACFVSARWR